MKYTRKALIFIVTIALAPAHADYELRESYIEDIHGGVHFFQREARANPDGSYTIIPRERPAELKRIHQEICGSIGAADVTQEHILTLGKGAVDAVVCHSETQPDQRHEFDGSEPTIMSSSLQINPPNATVNLNANFLLSGSFNYHVYGGGPYNATMSGGNCSTSISGNISGMGAGSRTLVVQCHAFDAGTYNSTLTACIPGLCASGHGVIIVNP